MKRIWKIAVAVGGSTLWILVSNSWFLAENRLCVFFLNVDQGDAILVVTPDHKTVLIDGGPGDYVLSELGAVLPPWVRSIDLLVLTHPHADHLSGLLDVLERFSVKEALYYPICYSDSEYEYFRKVVDGGVGVVGHDTLRNGYKVDLGGAVVSLFVGSYISGGDGCIDSADSTNDSSIVAVVSYGDVKVLLMGDAEELTERRLLAGRFRALFRGATILKAGHHCSRTASSDVFLDYSRPELAICSCGKDNSFGHPHEETIERFEERNIPYLRTDELGTIVVSTDGVTWEISE